MRIQTVPYGNCGVDAALKLIKESEGPEVVLRKLKTYLPHILTNTDSATTFIRPEEEVSWLHGMELVFTKLGYWTSAGIVAICRYNLQRKLPKPFSLGQE